ncbi:MAG TPA: GNAT family N-acetyltransferase [Ohtaekwangia sp.]
MFFRKATRNDLPFIVEMLANDKLGKLREAYTDPFPDSYHRAFDAIDADPNQELIVADNGNEIIGTMQITFTPGLTYQGSIRATVEAVRVKENMTGQGIGQQMIEWAIARARERKAHIIQLTSNKQRPDAIRFYEKVGFIASHEGLKMEL